MSQACKFHPAHWTLGKRILSSRLIWLHCETLSQKNKTPQKAFVSWTCGYIGRGRFPPENSGRFLGLNKWVSTTDFRWPTSCMEELRVPPSHFLVVWSLEMEASPHLEAWIPCYCSDWNLGGIVRQSGSTDFSCQCCPVLSCLGLSLPTKDPA